MRVSLDPLVVPQNPGDKRTLFVRIRHNNYTTPTCTTRCEQHKLVLSLKLITKTFIEFPKFNWSYYLLRYMLQTLFVPFIDQKYTPTVIKQVLSRPTVGTKSNDGGQDRRVTVFTGSYRPASTPQKKGRYVARRTTETTITSCFKREGCDRLQFQDER